MTRSEEQFETRGARPLFHSTKALSGVDTFSYSAQFLRIKEAAKKCELTPQHSSMPAVIRVHSDHRR